ncbi:hypothetical protein Pyn_05924 [Prunus yedoensis var. nudiflora]|uniref:Uncharacterized protein n=1 Tax=Prunus yedoensis var. nudiflora TaxID=2094558 RepID=A0A314XU43_PRUYE|nr:hypothetical protein Pyn_05924 [Prunus yedoensis var. nudiflora]
MDHLSMMHIGGLLPQLHSLQIPLHGSSLLWFLDGSSDGCNDDKLIWLGGYLVHPIFIGTSDEFDHATTVSWVVFYPRFL